MSPPTSHTSTKRLLQELSSYNTSGTLPPWLDRLAPLSPDTDLLHWEAVFRGAGLPGGYEHGRWKLDISVPNEYPMKAPVVRFVDSRVVGANVDFTTGEICLDLLKDAWTPAYTLLMTVEAIRMMLQHPEIDSPLNVDVAVLLRQGDSVGAESLVRWFCESESFVGP